MNRSDALRRGLLALALAVPGVMAVPTSSAQAEDGPVAKPVICASYESYTKFNTFASSRRLTHAKYVSVPKGASYSSTTGVQSVRQLTSSVSYSVSSSVSAAAVVASMEVKAGLDLATSGSRTSTASETVAFNFGPGRYGAFRGYKYFTGSWSAMRCVLSGTKEEYSNGGATNFAVPAEGAALCTVSYAAGTFEALAKAYAC